MKWSDICEQERWCGTR